MSTRGKFTDLTGQVFGQLTVRRYAGRNKFDQILWEFECSCSAHTRKKALGQLLKVGRITTCGECPNDFEHRLDGVTVLKIVRRSGEVLDCLVDTADFDLVKKYRWTATNHESTPYAEACNKKSLGGRGGHIRMHRFLFPDAENVDHKFGNGLDNRRSMLRPTSRSLNNAARRTKKNASGYRGVCSYGHHRKYKAEIGSFGKKRHLGVFTTAVAAARAYDAAAVIAFGEFAKTNFPRRAR